MRRAWCSSVLSCGCAVGASLGSASGERQPGTGRFPGAAALHGAGEGSNAVAQDPQDLPNSIELEGASNLRDLGGWPAADGRRVRPGRIYRSATLANLTEADMDRIGALGLRTVFDLRGLREAEARPSRLPAGAERVHVPIEPTVGASLRDLLQREQATGEDVVALLRRAYLDYTARFLGVYRQLFALLLEAGRGPLLFHCSAGKDRTGVGAALVLTALGASRQT